MGCAKNLIYLSMLYILCICPHTHLLGQLVEDNHSDSWYILHADSKISERWRIPTIGIIRYHDIFDDREFSFISSGLSYSNHQNCSFTTGFAYLGQTGLNKDYDSSLDGFPTLTKRISQPGSDIDFNT